VRAKPRTSNTGLTSRLVLCRFSIRRITPPSILTSSKRVCQSMVGLVGDSCRFHLSDPISGILNNTRTTLGRNLLREWLLRPSLSLPVIAARHAAVACFVDPDNITTAGDIQGHMSGIKNTPRAFKMLKSGRGKVQDWQGVVKVRLHRCRAT
jgi:hypothetical protein